MGEEREGSFWRRYLRGNGLVSLETEDQKYHSCHLDEQGSTLFLPEQVTADESHGTAVEPASLYEAQLLLRLGSLPQWLQELKGE